MKEKTVAFAPGRWSPAHQGHIMLFLYLLDKFDELIIGIGSCYEVGLERHPLLAFKREKMIHMSLVNAGVDMRRVSFVHLKDFINDWDGWWKHTTSIPRIAEVTHFATGNVEQIIGEIEKRKIKLPFKIINSKKDLPAEYIIPYCATDLRRAIVDGDYESFKKIAASGTVNLMGSFGGFEAIRQAMSNSGIKFVHGRQAVDMVFTCGAKSKKYVLTGYREKGKGNFPGWLAIPGGAIDPYESPIDAVLRELKEETNLEVEIVNRCLEPAHVLVKTNCGNIIAEMKFVALFSTEDQSLGGNEGGSCQAFSIDLDVTPDYFNGLIESKSDLEKVMLRPVDQVLKRGLAYQQTDMLRRAVN